MMLSGCYEPRLNDRAVKLLLLSATVLSARASMRFYPANGLLPSLLQSSWTSAHVHRQVNAPGSTPLVKTIGMVEVAPLAATTLSAPPVAANTATLRRTRSAAISGSLS